MDREQTTLLRYADVGITRIMPRRRLCRIRSCRRHGFPYIPVFSRTLMLD